MTKLISLAIVIMFLSIAGCNDPGKEPAAAQSRVGVGTQAPDFVLRDLYGKKISLSEHKGKVVILNFWKMKCRECLNSMPSLESLKQRLKGHDAVVLAINVDNLEYVKPAKIRALIEDNSYTFSVGVDETFSASEAYKVIALPMTYFIGREGVISYVNFGEDDWVSRGNIERIQALLKAQ